jgi:hypothetical protein
MVNKRKRNKIVIFIDKKFFFSIKPQKKVKNKGWKVKKKLNKREFLTSTKGNLNFNSAFF